MFDISFAELLVIGVIALVVIGPERLPKVARTVGHLLGRAQRYVNDVKGDIQREVELDELRKMKEEMEKAARDVQKSMHETQASIEQNIESPLASLSDQRAEVSSANPTSSTPQKQPAVSTEQPASENTASPTPTQGKLL